MKRAFNLLKLVAVLVAFAAGSAGARTQGAMSASPLWGDLKPGRHAVGYRTIFARDLSRPSIAAPNRMPGSAGSGRQMQINVWYPADAATARRFAPMRFEEYARLLLQETDFAPLRVAQERQVAEKFLENPVELGGAADKIRPHLPALMRMMTAAIKDAPPSAGRFPLVVFPSYRTPATQSIMCEYLASHGFVVASIGLKGTLDAEPEISLAGVETLSADMQFAVGTLRALPVVDGEKLALIGLGFSATGCMALLTRNTEVDALISLDGGILSAFEDRMLKRTPFYEVSAIRAPLLAIHAPHPNIDPVFLDQYKYSTRHVVHFPRMSEFYFLNYGMMEKFVPGIIGTPPGDTKAGFEWASRYCLHFLKAYLNGEPASMEFLRNEPSKNLVPENLLAVSLKKELTSPPTLTQLKAMIQKDGIGSLIYLYRRLKDDDPQPFSQETFTNLYNWLSYRRDPDWQSRKSLSLLRVESYPESSRAHFTLAGVALQLGEKELARKHYTEALRLLENDPDPTLDYGTRKRIEQGAQQNLKNLD